MEISGSGSGGGTPLTVTDGSTTVNNVNNITFAGAVVTNGGGGIADVAITALTNPMTTTGDIIYSSNNSGSAARLGIGSSAQFLVVNTGLPSWQTLSGSGATISLSAAGVLSISAIANASLSNSTISGVSLGSNLNSLTVDNSSLQLDTGTTYNGSAARTVSVKNLGITNAMLAGSIAASKLVGTDIATVGTVTAGTWNGTKIGLAYGGTNADLSATGGASQVLKQVSSGAAITVGQLASTDLSDVSSLVTLTGTQTLTNKRVTKRITTASDATSITPNSDNCDWINQSNTQSAGTLTINNDTGTPTGKQALGFEINCTNAQTLSWGNGFVGGATALPTATTGSSKSDFFTFVYSTIKGKWVFTGQQTNV